MRTRTLVAALCLLLPATSNAATASLGLGSGLPDYLFFAGSVFPGTTHLSLDARVGLSVAEGGLTGHIPFAASDAGVHSALIAGLAGYNYNAVHNGLLGTASGTHLTVQAGYGFLERFDFRVLLGFSTYQTAVGWGRGVGLTVQGGIVL